MFGFWRLGHVDWVLDDDDMPRAAPWMVTTHDGWTQVVNGFRCDCGELCGTETVWRNHATDYGLRWLTTNGQKGSGARWSDIIGKRESA